VNPIELLGRFADAIADPVLLVNLELKIAAANQAAAEMLGVDRRALAGRPLAEFVDETPESIAGMAARWRRSSGRIPAALRVKTPSGKSVRVHCTGSAVRVNSYRLLVLHCRASAEPARRFVALNEKIQQLASEVAERARAEAALRESEIRFRSIFQQAHDPIIITDQQGRIIDANPAAVELTGRHLDELLGLTPIDLAPPDYKATAEELWHAFDVSGSQRGAFPILRPDGELRHTEYSAVRDFVPGQSLSIVRDTTERRRIEAERDRKTAELARSNAELERFAYIASHDLQEPLRTMHSFAQLLERRLSRHDDPSVRECLDFIVDSALRMRRIILDLLDFSRLGQAGVNMREVLMASVVEAAIENLAAGVAECGARLEIGELPVVRADETQMIQLFQNLIGNALKFRSEAPPHIRIYSAAADGAYVFSVADNGPGIAPEYFDAIFEAFKRLHGRDIPGTGIGLAVCRRIVENHNGRIWVESTQGKGSTFYVALPMTQSEAETNHRAGRQRRTEAGQRL
jgi:PAS domain S-box-containing protein